MCLSQTRTAFLSRDSLAASRSLHACKQHRHPRQTNDTPPGIRSTYIRPEVTLTHRPHRLVLCPPKHTQLYLVRNIRRAKDLRLWPNPAHPSIVPHEQERGAAAGPTEKLHTHKMLRRLTRTESSPPRKRAASVPTPLLRPARRERRASGASLLRALASPSLAPDARRARSILSSCCHECRCNTARHKRTGKLMLTSAPRSRPRTLDSRPSPCSCPRVAPHETQLPASPIHECRAHRQCLSTPPRARSYAISR